MEKKNSKMRALRTGIIAAAAAVMLMGNMAAYAAEDDAEPVGIFEQENMIAGTVSEVGTDSITVSVSGMAGEAGFGMGMPREMDGFGMPDGQTPPGLPDGEMPEPPEGEGPEFSEGERPEFPEGERPEPPEGERPEFSEGEFPEGMDGLMGRPEGGMPQGGQPEGMPLGGFGTGAESASEVTVKIDSGTVIVKGSGDESASLSDITAGSNVIVSLDGDTALIIAILG